MPEVPIRRRTIPLGAARMIEIEGGEEGFELYLETDDGARYVVNIHACAPTLLEAVIDHIVPWWQEGLAARASRPVPDDADAYDPDDPKHPGYSVKVAAWDEREGK